MTCPQLIGEDQLGPGTRCLPCVHTTPMKQLFYDIVTVFSHTGVLHQERQRNVYAEITRLFTGAKAHSNVFCLFFKPGIKLG